MADVENQEAPAVDIQGVRPSENVDKLHWPIQWNGASDVGDIVMLVPDANVKRQMWWPKWPKPSPIS